MAFGVQRGGMQRCRPQFLTARFDGPVAFSNSGWQWWLGEGQAHRPAQTIDHHFHAGAGSGVTLLREKAARSRRLYSLAPPSLPATPRHFVKQMAVSPRKRLGALLGCSNALLGFSHGTAELAHNLALHERTVHGVRTFAFGEYFRHGLPVQQVLLQEYLLGWQPFNVVWQAHEHEATRRHALLSKLIAMLASLRDAGISHLDLHPGDVMVSPDPQAPLRAIDCGQMSMAADPAILTAMHLSVFLHELNGKRLLPSPQLEESARTLLYRLVGGEAEFAGAERLVSLLVRYSSKKPFSRRRLLQRRRERLDTSIIETRLQALSHSRSLPAQVAHASSIGSRQELRLIASIEDVVTMAP